MKRIILGIMAGYLLAAITWRAAEATGIGQRRCGCESDCWCKNPALTAFRWATPTRIHHIVPLSPTEKQSLADRD
jgi:hypothetical protein